MKIAVKTFPRSAPDKEIEDWANSHGRTLDVAIIPDGLKLRVVVQYMEQDTLLEE